MARSQRSRSSLHRYTIHLDTVTVEDQRSASSIRPARTVISYIASDVSFIPVTVFYMGIPNVVYKWSSLKILYVTVFAMNVAGLVIVVVMIVSAVKLKKGFGDYLNLIIPGDGYLWPILVITAAVICAPIYAIGVKLCFQLSIYRVPVDDLPRLDRFLFYHVLLCLVSIFLMIGINVAIVVHSSNFRNRIHDDGLVEAMQNYATDAVSKVRLDMLQIEFHCCGSKTYKDWFFIPWMLMDSKNVEVREQSNASQFISADVPFSCCSANILRPCVHHDILKPDDVYAHDPRRRLTIWTAGCQSRILARADIVGNLLIGALCLLSGYQLLLSILSRLLQTAHSDTLYIGSKRSWYRAWIFGRVPNQDDHDEPEYKGDEKLIEKSSECTRSAPSSFVLQSRASCSKSVSLTLSECRRLKTKLLGKVSSMLSTRSKSADDVKSKILFSAKLAEDEEDEEEEEEEEKDAEEDEDEQERKPLMMNTMPSPSVSISLVNGTKSLTTRLSRAEESVTSEDSDEDKGRSGRRQERVCRRNKFASLQQLNVSSSFQDESPEVEINEYEEDLDDHSRHQVAHHEATIDSCPPPSPPTRHTCDRTTSMSSHWRRLGNKIEEPDDQPFLHVFARGRSSRKNGRIDSDRTRSSRGPGIRPCRKDSNEERDSRLRKFCRDLCFEYNNSPFVRQRREFSERWQQVRGRPNRYQEVQDVGRDIRNQVCAKFNPADAYGRFRGSVQDTLTRREKLKRRSSAVPRKWLCPSALSYLPRAPMTPFQQPPWPSSSYNRPLAAPPARSFPPGFGNPDRTSSIRRLYGAGSVYPCPSCRETIRPTCHVIQTRGPVRDSRNDYFANRGTV